MLAHVFFNFAWPVQYCMQLVTSVVRESFFNLTNSVAWVEQCMCHRMLTQRTTHTRSWPSPAVLRLQQTSISTELNL
jgi:hypothetical protein